VIAVALAYMALSQQKISPAESAWKAHLRKASYIKALPASSMEAEHKKFLREFNAPKNPYSKLPDTNPYMALPDAKPKRTVWDVEILDPSNFRDIAETFTTNFAPKVGDGVIVHARKAVITDVEIMTPEFPGPNNEKVAVVRIRYSDDENG